MDFIIQNFNEFLTFTGFANASAGNLIMILVGALFIWLAIKKDFEPLLLVPIGLGIILGNIPFRADAGLENIPIRNYKFSSFPMVSVLLQYAEA